MASEVLSKIADCEIDASGDFKYILVEVLTIYDYLSHFYTSLCRLVFNSKFLKTWLDATRHSFPVVIRYEPQGDDDSMIRRFIEV